MVVSSLSPSFILFKQNSSFFFNRPKLTLTLLLPSFLIYLFIPSPLSLFSPPLIPLLFLDYGCIDLFVLLSPVSVLLSRKDTMYTH